MKKTVQVVRKLCEPYRDSYRTIYVDRFYTSLELLKELDKMNLFVTGTVMKNRISKDMVINKSSKQFKEMQRGDFKRHLYGYDNEEEQRITYGLVCWKDKDIVYCMSNTTSTEGVGECKRRSANGIITIKRPNIIGEYNKYMGGVDLADMRRLHCNSTIMGSNRWWLKLFFYLLDVGTANALVLYRLTQTDKGSNMSIVDFKKEIVQELCKKVFRKKERKKIEEEPKHEQEPIEGDTRLCCAYCACFGIKRRTRFRCMHPECLIPLCAIGSGKTAMDCFVRCHETEITRQMTLAKYKDQLRKTNIRYRK